MDAREPLVHVLQDEKGVFGHGIRGEAAPDWRRLQDRGVDD
jgi:hypothetical protein